MKILTKNTPERIAKEIGVEFSTTEDFFKNREKVLNTKKIILGNCDYGIVYQSVFHPNDDLRKMSYRIPFDMLEQEREYYSQVVLTTQDSSNCNIKDKFGIKIDCFTSSTHYQLPMVAMPNSDVFEGNILWLPFGMNEDSGDGIDNVLSCLNKQYKKKNWLYVNFEENTFERLKIKAFFERKNFPFVTYRKNKIPHSQYIEEMAEHVFVLCPSGNGMDCYRNYEAQYANCIPLIIGEFENWKFEFARNFPLLKLSSIEELSLDVLVKGYGIFSNYSIRDNEKLYENYWINECKKFF